MLERSSERAEVTGANRDELRRPGHPSESQDEAEEGARSRLSTATKRTPNVDSELEGEKSSLANSEVKHSAIETAMSGAPESDDDPRKRPKKLEHALERVEECSDLRGEGNSPEMARNGLSKLGSETRQFPERPGTSKTREEWGRRRYEHVRSSRRARRLCGRAS